MDLVGHDNRSPLSLLERYLLRYHVEDRARVLGRHVEREYLIEKSERRATLLKKGWIQKESRIRKDAIGKSEAVINGRVTEHMVPFFPAFSYNPK